jgi:hypothetical protein
VEYNSTTGAVIKQGTVQGYSDNRYEIYFNLKSAFWKSSSQYLESRPSMGIVRFCEQYVSVNLSDNHTPNESVVHKRTNQLRYLETARHMANYFISQIPSDGIVPWSVPCSSSLSPKSDKWRLCQGFQCTHVSTSACRLICSDNRCQRPFAAVPTRRESGE